MTGQKLSLSKDDKDQSLFKKACEKILGRDWFQAVSAEARDAYKKATSLSDCDVKKANMGIRAGNLVLLEAIREAGVTNWRQFMDEQNVNGFDRKQYQTTPQPVKPQTKTPKRDGSALDKMISEQIEKRKSR